MVPKLKLYFYKYTIAGEKFKVLLEDQNTDKSSECFYKFEFSIIIRVKTNYSLSQDSSPMQ